MSRAVSSDFSALIRSPCQRWYCRGNRCETKVAAIELQRVGTVVRAPSVSPSLICMRSRSACESRSVGCPRSARPVLLRSLTPSAAGLVRSGLTYSRPATAAGRMSGCSASASPCVFAKLNAKNSSNSLRNPRPRRPASSRNNPARGVDQPNGGRPAFHPASRPVRGFPPAALPRRPHRGAELTSPGSQRQ